MEPDKDREDMLDSVASECMEAIEKKDKERFIDCLHVLVSDIVTRMGSDSSEKY